MSVLSVFDTHLSSEDIWWYAVQFLRATAGIACLKFLLGWGMRRRVRKKIQRKQEAHRLAIENMGMKMERLQMSSADIERITSLPLSNLITSLKTGELKAVDVLHAYQSKAYEQNQAFNFITEPIAEAEAEAQILDAQTERKPLHGVPISVKDCYGIKGYDCCIGLAACIDRPWEEDSVVIKVLKYQGAVPFVKTNVPQTMLAYDTSNAIFGVTKNPLDPRRSAGGSSGGEGCSVCAKASICGMGSDIGGSIRVPSAFCGVFGFKPTTRRISTKGNNLTLAGMKQIEGAFGPLARDVESLVIMMKALLVPYMFELDPCLPPVPFREECYTSTRRLRIGYYDDDGYCPVVPAIKRAVHLAKAALEKQGHELVPWIPYKAPVGVMDCYIAGMVADGFRSIVADVKNDQVDQCMRLPVTVGSMPNWMKTILSWLSHPFSIKMSQTFKKARGVGTPEGLYRFTANVEAWRDQFLNDWHNHGLDGVICPATACTTVPIGVPGLTQHGYSYATLYNVANCPAGIVPVTKVTPEDEEQLKDYPTPEFWQKIMKKGCEDSVGLPVCVQCVALPWHDEQCLRIMKELETGLKQE